MSNNTLTDIYNDINAQDAVYLEKRAEEIKVAEEEDAAGRITARGFADELHKLAQGPAPAPQLPAQAKPAQADRKLPTGGFGATSQEIKIKKPKKEKDPYGGLKMPKGPAPSLGGRPSR